MDEYKAIIAKKKNPMRELESVDTADMLKTASSQIKVMRQILDRVIPADDSHTILSENILRSIEVIPKNLMTFRVPSKNACSPAKFIIKYNDSADDD